MRIVWAACMLACVFVGTLAIAVAASDIQWMLAFMAFTCGAACGANVSIYTGVAAIKKSIADAKTVFPPHPLPPSNDGMVAALNQIRAELQWQRQQKEKEIHRAKAAASTKPTSRPPSPAAPPTPAPPNRR